MQSNFCVPGIADPNLKDTIVSSYFLSWTKIVLPHAKKAGNRFGFFDFCCGSGKNEDGSETAPQRVLRSAVENEEIANQLVSVFCDKDQKNIIKLRQVISNIEVKATLAYEPYFEKGSTCAEWMNNLQKIRLMPALAILDVLSIKDWNLDLISTQIMEGGFDGILLFNYSLLESMIDNPFKAKHLETAFGKTAADKVRSVVDRLNPEQKESFIIKTFLDRMKSMKGYHAVTFTYKVRKDIYYLVFFTRYVKRYHLMKDVISKERGTEIDICMEPLSDVSRCKRSVQAGLFNE